MLWQEVFIVVIVAAVLLLHVEILVRRVLAILIASLVEDQDVLEQARIAAEAAIAQDPKLDRWPQLRAELAYRYRKLMGGAILT